MGCGASQDGTKVKAEPAQPQPPSPVRVPEPAAAEQGSAPNLEPSAPPPAGLRSFYDQVDTSKTGSLSSKELKGALRAVGLPATIDFDEVFKSFDTVSLRRGWRL